MTDEVVPDSIDGSAPDESADEARDAAARIELLPLEQRAAAYLDLHEALVRRLEQPPTA